jgi:hypothetical protein
VVIRLDREDGVPVDHEGRGARGIGHRGIERNDGKGFEIERKFLGSLWLNGHVCGEAMWRYLVS